MKNIAIILLFSMTGLVYSQDQKKPYPEKYLPKDLYDALDYMDFKWTKKEKKKFKNQDEKSAVSNLHFGYGMWIRNTWIRHGQKSLIDFFTERGIYAIDDMSSIILTSFHRKLNNTDIGLDEQIKFYINYWEESQKADDEYQKIVEDSENNLHKVFEKIEWNTTEYTKHLKLPIQKTSHQKFCTEFIKYKNGYIINSLTTYPDQSGIGITYNYFYLDMVKQQIYKLKFSDFDYVESVLSCNSSIIVSGKKNKIVKIIEYKENSEVEISNLTNQKTGKLNNESWLKLGSYKNNVYGLQYDGFYILNQNKWDLFSAFDYENFDSYIFKPLIPTENIVITKDKLYFLEENIQQRNCNLYEMDFRTKEISNFLYKNSIHADIVLEVDSYTLDNENVYVTTNKESLFLEKEGKLSVLIKEEKTKDDTSENKIQICKVVKSEDKTYFIAINGIFEYRNNIIIPLVYFENTTQDIRYKENVYHHNFIPRACVSTEPNKFLIGGLYGSIYLIDIDLNTVVQFDDQEETQNLNFKEIK